jgi:RNA polymerase sigma-70 factor (ECF subfamily)
MRLAAKAKEPIMSTVLDLATILAQAQAGHPTAIAELYTQYGAPVQRYCYARLRSVEAAGECTQEIFIRVWKHIPTFEYRGGASFTSWLYTIANHVVISYVRTWWRPAQVSLTPALHLADDRTSDTTRMICDHLALRDALSQLTREHQQVITLKFFGGLSNLEIAERMGRTEGAVKSLQHRAIHRLQRLLIHADVDQLVAA